MRALTPAALAVTLWIAACSNDGDSEKNGGAGGAATGGANTGGAGGGGASATGGASGAVGGTSGSSGGGGSSGSAGSAGDAGCAPPSVPPPDAGAGCNPTTGYGGPLPVCSTSNPCTLPMPPKTGTITAASDVPGCKTTKTHHPAFDDGPAKSATGIDGTTRSWCEYSPPGTSASSLRPLVVWFHGAGGSADDLYDLTLLRQKAAAYDLSGDPQRPGFVLFSIQGRNLHWPTEDPRDSSHHDVFYRDFASCSTNPDFANADRRIDEIVATGGIDPKRIYVMGWSNGGHFAQSYALVRHHVATPGGNRVAATAVYSAADPFDNTRDSQTPSCQLSPYPTSQVPLYIVSGWCDIIACDSAQAADLEAGGNVVIAPGAVVEPWIADLATKLQNPNVKWQRITGQGAATQVCAGAGLCGPTIAALVHVEWPDGIATTAGGTTDWEPSMLDWLRTHPLP